MFSEEVINWKGQKVVRVKSGFILLLGLISVISGAVLYVNNYSWGTLLILNSTMFFIYPIVRFFIGGKDSIAGIVGTAVADAYIKNKIDASIKKRSKR